MEVVEAPTLDAFVSEQLPTVSRSIEFLKTVFHSGPCAAPVQIHQWVRPAARSAPNNAQLRVFYAQIWILTQKLEIHASFWRTHIFKAIEIVDAHIARQRDQMGQMGNVRNAKICLPNHILVRDADWFKCHFRQLYFKAGWSEIHFLFTPLI